MEVGETTAARSLALSGGDRPTALLRTATRATKKLSKTQRSITSRSEEPPGGEAADRAKKKQALPRPFRPLGGGSTTANAILRLAEAGVSDCPLKPMGEEVKEQPIAFHPRD